MSGATASMHAPPAEEPEEDPVFPCGRCGAPFARESYRALHVGRGHGAPMSQAEQAAFDAALAEEDAWVADMRRHGQALLRIIPLLAFAFVFVVVAVNANVNPAFLALVLPGSLVATAILYYVTYENA